MEEEEEEGGGGWGWRWGRRLLKSAGHEDIFSERTCGRGEERKCALRDIAHGYHCWLHSC